MEEVDKLEEAPQEETQETQETKPEEPERQWGYCKVHGKVLGIVKGKGRGRKARCPHCNRILKMTPYEEEEVKTETEEEEEFEEMEEEFISPEEEFIEKAIAYLEKELPRYGVKSPYLKIVLDTLRSNPDILKNPSMLHMHIKSICRNANDYLLTLVIRGLFNKYGDLLQQPSVTPQYIDINQPTTTLAPTQYNPSYPSTTFNPHAVQPNVPYPIYPTMATPAPSPTPKRKYKIAIDGQVIEVEDYKEYIALKEWEERRRKEEEERQRRQQEHELKMKKLEVEIQKMLKPDNEEGEKKDEKKTEEDQVIKALNSRLQFLESQLNKVLEEKKKLEETLKEMERQKELERVQRLEEELKELREIVKDPLSLVTAYEEKLMRLGFTKSGKSLLDILDGARQDIGNTIRQLVQKLPAQPLAPNQQVKYTEDERIAKIRQIKEGLKQSEDLARVEQDLIRTAEKIYVKKFG